MSGRLVVIGGSGFVGSAVVAAARDGWAEVQTLPAPRVTSRAADLPALLAEVDASDVETFAGQLAGADAVVNAAGSATPGAPASPDLVGADALLPALVGVAARRAGVGRFVHVSGAAVQGTRDQLDESWERAAFSPYSTSKALGEQALRHQDDPAVVVFRATSVHGAARQVTRTLARVRARSRVSSVAGPGGGPTPQSLVENLADAVLHVAGSAVAPPPVVLHPWEGLTCRAVLVALGDREPARVPVPGRSPRRGVRLRLPEARPRPPPRHALVRAESDHDVARRRRVAAPVGVRRLVASGERRHRIRRTAQPSSEGAPSMSSQSTTETRPVVIVGLGYVGLPLARAAAARRGLDVIGLDRSADVVAGLGAGTSHVDDLSDADVRAMLDDGFRPTSKVAGDRHGLRRGHPRCRPRWTATGGPTWPRSSPPRSRSALLVGPGTLVVLESTTYPGTTDEVIRPIIERDGLVAGEDFFLAFSPSGSTPATRSTGSRTRPRSSGGTRRGAARSPPTSTAGSSTGSCWPADRVKPRWPSCSRTPTGTSTSPS